LLDWLSELLAAFELQRLVFRRFEVHVHAEGLSARAFGEPIDPSRHRMAHEVKAITYHGLRVTPVGSGWQADVIVDI
jgi:SHS2 domain-containing protein